MEDINILKQNSPVFEMPKVIIMTEPKAIFGKESGDTKWMKHPSWGDCTC